MLDGGANLATCRFVFRTVFERQNEAGKRPAGMLRYMRDAVAEALADPLEIPEKYRRSAKGHRFRNPKDIEHDERVASYRRAVAEGRTPFWLEDDCGEAPAVEASR